MERRSWLLLAVGEQIEPIQLQKTLFKFAKESKAPATESYEFVPYNWGACSFDIYDDLSALRAEGLVEVVPTGRGWSLYRLTDPGKAKVVALREQADAALVKALDGARSWVISRSFDTLLRDIYEQYPEYATESLFKKQ